MQEIKDHLSKEISLFETENLWEGGFCQQENLENSEIVSRCIKHYVGNKSVLEIGPGRGFWTKKILQYSPQNILCLDALSVKHNCFWEYVGVHNQNIVRYYQINNFGCDEVEDNSIDYLFSYDVFCHISFYGINAYMAGLKTKIRSGSDCFVMIADRERYQKSSAWERPIAREKIMRSMSLPDERISTNPRRFHFIGMERFTSILNKNGFNIINNDVTIDLLNITSPIVHFRRL